MAWFKIDDQVTFHAKVIRAGNAAFGALVRLGAYCNAQLSDGFVSDALVSLVATKREIDALTGCGLLHRVSDGYQIHDYLEYQPSRAEVTAERSAIRERVKRHRNGVTGKFGNGVTNGVTAAVTNATVTPAPTRPDPIPIPDLNTYEQMPAPVDGLTAPPPDAVPATPKRRGRKPKPIASRFDLEPVYAAYPRKLGRKPGMDALARQIQTQADYETATRGVAAFAAAMQAEKRPADKIPYFSTWVNQEQWRDYANGETTTAPTGAAAKRNWHEPAPHTAKTEDLTDELP